MGLEALQQHIPVLHYVSKNHTMKDALGACYWSASLLRRFTLEGRTPGTHWTGG
jgi:hypothetical protein